MRNSAPLPQLQPRIDRPHLVEMMHAAGTHPVMLVCAPPGYGKTTAVQQLLEARKDDVLWSHLDMRDRDGFSLDARFRQQLSSMLGREIAQPTHISGGQQLAAELIDQLKTHLQHPLTLVFDDLHILDGAPGAEAWLRTLVRQAPPQCKLILISRTIPSIPATELLAAGKLSAIGQEQLALSERDLPYLLREYPQRPEAELRSTLKSFAGWTTGVILSLRPIPAMLQPHFDPKEIESVFSLMADKLFEQQTPPVREFLLQSSVLPVFTAHLCDSLLGIDDAEAMLTTARQHNLFIESVQGGWRYHPLFRDFLQARLQQRYPDLYRTLHARIALSQEERNEIVLAVDHYLQAGQAAEAARLVEMVSHAYLIRGQYDALLHFDRALAIYEQHTPNLHLVIGIMHLNRYEFDDAHQRLNRAEIDFAATGQVIMQAEVEIQRATIEVNQGKHAEAFERLQQVLEIPDLPYDLRGHALHVLGRSAYGSGDLDTAIDQLELALESHEQLGDDLAVSIVLQDLQLMYTDGGYMQNAENALQHLVALRRKIGNPGQLAVALNNLGCSHHAHGDYALAHEVFEEGLALARSSYHPRYTAALLWSYGDLLRDTGRFEQAQQCYREGLELIGDVEGYIRSNLLLSNATLCRWMGAEREGLRLAVEAEETARKHRLAMMGKVAEMHRLICQPHEPGNKAALLAACQSLSRSQPGQMLPLQVALAAESLRGGDEAGAEESLLQALHTADRFHRLQALAAEIIALPEVLAFVRRRPTVFAALDEPFLRLERARPGHRVIATLPEPERVVQHLQVKVLGAVKITRDGQLLSSADWRSERSRELFLYLLLQGPVSREAISAMFWPDESAKRVRSNFHTTLYRTRAAFGEDTVIYEDDLYQLNPAVEIDCDAVRFVTLIEQARPLAPRSPRAEDLWCRAARLYEGRLMPDLYSSWAMDLQQRYEQLAAEVYIGLGDCARARSAIDEALGYYRTALREAPYREDIDRRVLALLGSAGRRGEVASYWQRLRQVYHDELMVAPSPQTERLVQGLLA